MSDETKKNTGSGKKILYTVIGLVAFAAMVKACGGNDKHSTSGGTNNSTPAIQISAAELVEAYKANEVAADAKYKGKDLIVEGTIDNIGKDIMDDMYVVFTSGGQFERRETQCFFDSEHQGALAKLSKGQRIKIRGECKGMMGTVHLDDCTIVQ